MAYIDKDYKRLLRIYGRPGIFTGHTIEVYDDESNEPINNVLSMTIRLDARNATECEVTYAEMDRDGKILVSPDSGFEPIINTIALPNIHIAGITAWEVDSWEQEFDRTFCLYEPTEDGYENAEDKVKAFIRELLGRK